MINKKLANQTAIKANNFKIGRQVLLGLILLLMTHSPGIAQVNSTEVKNERENLSLDQSNLGEVKTDNAITWYNPISWGVEGRGWSEGLTRYYDRLPTKAEKLVPDGVWKFSRESSGISVRFITDATSINVRYNLLSSNMSHGWGDMSGMSSSGVDLYTQVVDLTSGRTIWRWVGGNKPTMENCNDCLVNGLDPGNRLYVLHLPVYNGVEKLEIGVPSNATFEPVEPRKEPPIVFYGTSIMQGGIASRPGLAIPAVISRHLNKPVVNLGFCGSGRMDAPVVELISEINASVYVIDCLPNMDAALVSQRTEPLVRKLRETHPLTPILLVECHNYPSPGLFPGMTFDIQRKQAALHDAYDRLVKSGVKNLHYLSGKSLIGYDSEGTGDGIHPNALGMFRYCEAYKTALSVILSKPTQ